MAKHLGTQLLRPATSVGRKQSRPLPPNSLLIRKPIQPGPSLRQAKKQSLPTVHYGQHIYLYNNIATNQIVYSLTRHLNVYMFLHPANYTCQYRGLTLR